MNRETNEVLYLFSSNSTPLYKVDALNSLAMPTGWIQHFRYQAKYVDVRIGKCEDDQRKLDRFLGIRVIVVSVNQEKRADSERDWDVKGVYPIRFGTLVRLRNESGVIHFWFSLAERFVYPTDNETTSSAEILSQQLRAMLNTDGPDGLKYASLASGQPLLSSRQASDSQAFVSVVKALTNQGFAAEKTLFTMVTDVVHTRRESDSDGSLIYRTSSVPITSGPANGLSGYELIDNIIYTINLSSLNEVLPGQDLGVSAVLSLKVSKDYFEVIGPSEITVTGRYDQYQFVVKPKRQARNQWAIASIGCTSSNDDVSIVGFQWDIPILVKPDLIRTSINTVTDFIVPIGVAIGAMSQLSFAKEAADLLKLVSFAVVIIGIFFLGLKVWADHR